jgi:TolA-binding protein
MYLRVAATILFLAPVPAFAANALEIKTGLWEITTTMQSSGMPQIPPELLKQLAPEQRQQMEAQLRAMNGTPETRRQCVTKDDIDTAFDDLDESCKRKVVTDSARLHVSTFTCTGEASGSGTMRLEAPSSDRVTGFTEMRMASGGSNMEMKIDFSGKWLKADCPREQQE